MDDATFAKFIPMFGMTDIEGAKLLWQTQNIRLPGFNATLNRLNENDLLSVNKEPSKMTLASNVESVAEIREGQRANAWRSQQRDQWMALLDEQGLSVQPNAINANIYDFVYRKTKSSKDSQGGSHARYWLLKTYGNFPIGVDENGDTILLLNVWPSTGDEMTKVALYGMYPSLDSERRVMEKKIAIHQRSQYSVLVDLAKFGADTWNVQRVLDLGLNPKALGNSRKTVMANAIAHANIPVLEAINFRPYKVDLNSEDGIHQAVNILVSSRKDMWHYIMPLSKREMQTVYRAVAARLRITVRELLANLKE